MKNNEETGNEDQKCSFHSIDIGKRSRPLKLRKVKRLTHRKPLEVRGITYAKSIKVVKKDDTFAQKDSPVEDGKIEVNLVNNGSQLPKTKVKKKLTPKSRKVHKNQRQ